MALPPYCIEGNFLAVGGPSLKNDDHAGSHHGRVYIYNITKRDAFHGPYEIPVPSDLITISTDSEEGSSIGVQFGASFFVSEFLTTTSVPSIFVGIGAPGANGVVIYYLECSYSNNGNVANMFQVKGSVLIQGFRLKLDHDTGDGVSWDIQGERMLLGAPKADNYDEYGGVETSMAPSEGFTLPRSANQIATAIHQIHIHTLKLAKIAIVESIRMVAT